jgi:hypothetical protein
MSEDIKQQLHQLVDKCEDSLLLEEAKALLEAGDEKDWWDDLSEEDRNLIMESEIQYSKGNFINQDELMRRFKEWRKK